MHSLRFLVLGTTLSWNCFAGTHHEFHVNRFLQTEVEVQGKKFIKTSLEGIGSNAGVLAVEGRPETPVIRFYVEGEGEIQVIAGPRTRGRDFRAPRLLSGKSVPKHPAARAEIPKLAAPDDEELRRYQRDYTISTVGTQRGVLVRVVELYPIQWDPQTGVELRVQNFSVDLPTPPVSRRGARAVGIVVPQQFKKAESFGAWVDFKRKEGFQTFIYYLEANSSPELIRKVLQDWYKAAPGLEAVVLLGDVEFIPSYQSKIIEGFTDHYYAALDGDYAIDLRTPDVQVGRVPVRSEEELKEVLARMMEYSRLSPLQNVWLKKDALLATNDEEFWKRTEESLISLADRYFAPMGFMGNFPNAQMPGGDRLFAITHKATGSDLKSVLAEGRGFVLYSGHGAPTGWENPELKGQEVSQLNLNGALPFVFAFSCETGRFSEPSIAEAWVQRPYGAVSSVGSYNDTYWDEDFILQAAVMSEFLGAGGSVGLAIEKGQREVSRYYGGKGLSDYYWETYNVFSDPSLKYRGK